MPKLYFRFHSVYLKPKISNPRTLTIRRSANIPLAKYLICRWPKLKNKRINKPTNHRFLIFFLLRSHLRDLLGDLTGRWWVTTNPEWAKNNISLFLRWTKKLELISRHLQQLPPPLRQQTASLRYSWASQILLVFHAPPEIFLEA